MAPKIQVNDYDYKLAIEKVQELVDKETESHRISATEIVDLVIDTVLN